MFRIYVLNKESLCEKLRTIEYQLNDWSPYNASSVCSKLESYEADYGVKLYALKDTESATVVNTILGNYSLFDKVWQEQGTLHSVTDLVKSVGVGSNTYMACPKYWRALIAAAQTISSAGVNFDEVSDESARTILARRGDAFMRVVIMCDKSADVMGYLCGLSVRDITRELDKDGVLIYHCIMNRYEVDTLSEDIVSTDE